MVFLELLTEEIEINRVTGQQARVPAESGSGGQILSHPCSGCGLSGWKVDRRKQQKGPDTEMQRAARF